MREHAVAELSVSVFAKRHLRLGRVQDEWILSRRPRDGVVADEWPVPAMYGERLLVEAALHVDPVRNARAVREDERRPVVGLGLAECEERLLRIRPQRDARDIDIPVRDRLERDVLLADLLAAGRELRHGAERGGLGRLTPRVRVHLRIEDEDVHVATARQDVVNAPRADVVGPTIAADHPHASPYKRCRYRTKGSGGRRRRCLELSQEPGHPFSLRADLSLEDLRRAQDLVDELRSDLTREVHGEAPGESRELIVCEAKAEAELGVVLEQ